MKIGNNLRGEIKWEVGVSDEGGVAPAFGRFVRFPCPRHGAGGGAADDSYLRSAVMKNLLVKLVKDETGGEVLEYALIAGLIVVAAIAVIGTVGTKVLARWTSLNSSL